MEQRTIRVAIANDYEIVVRGLAAMLADVEGLEVVEMIRAEDPVQPPLNTPIDIGLYDTYGREGLDQPILRELLLSELIKRVVVFTLSWSDAMVDNILARGAA